MRTSYVLAGLLAVIVPSANPALARNADAPVQDAQSHDSGLTLPQAIEWALEKSPVIAVAKTKVDAAAASRSQTGALPNPEIGVEAENIFGDGEYDGTDNAEITYGISQLVELPGKRGNRLRQADAEKLKAAYAHEAARLDLIRDVTVAYVELAAAQQETVILEEEYRLATEVRDSVAAKVEAGKEPLIQKNKAEIERSASGIAFDRAQRNLTAKTRRLSVLMGGGVANFTVNHTSLPELSAPEEIEAYRALLVSTPEAASLATDIEKARAGLSLEKANALPDPTISLGMRDFRESNSRAFMMGVSLPLPVFNMNQAGIKKAGHDLSAASLDEKSAKLASDAALTQIHSDYGSAYSEAFSLKESVLPGAEEAFRFAREGYEAGKFSYLEVLDAQRTLFDARKQLNAAFLDYHRQRAEIERITAKINDGKIMNEDRK